MSGRDAHAAALAAVEAIAHAAAAGDGERSRIRHLCRRKMPPRDRVAGLLDPGSSFLETGAAAAHGMYDDATTPHSDPAMRMVISCVHSSGEITAYHVSPPGQALPAPEAPSA